MDNIIQLFSLSSQSKLYGYKKFIIAPSMIAQ